MMLFAKDEATDACHLAIYVAPIQMPIVPEVARKDRILAPVVILQIREAI